MNKILIITNNCGHDLVWRWNRGSDKIQNIKKIMLIGDHVNGDHVDDDHADNCGHDLENVYRWKWGSDSLKMRQQP